MCFPPTAGILHRMDADGSNVVALSANVLNDFTPAVMADGRLMYSRWEYVDKPAIPIQSAWTINPDGTMLQGFYGNRTLRPDTFIQCRQMPGRHEVLCVLTGHLGFVRGRLGLLDRFRGMDAPDGLTRLTPDDRELGRHTGCWIDPWPLDERHYLASRRGTVLLRTLHGQAHAEVIKRRRPPMGFYSPRPLRARPRPPVPAPRAEPTRASGTTDATPWAAMYVLDVYQGLLPHVARGEVKRIAVVEEGHRPHFADTGGWAFQQTVISCGATYAPKTLWGFADVEADGSAHFRVPARTPIYFMALDEHGRALQRMRTLTHLMPGERQGCIGCHEPRNTAPPVRRAAAVSRPPEGLREPEWGVRGFSYARLVQPVLDRHCVRCHRGTEPAAGMDLTGDVTDKFNVSYEMLARDNAGRRGSPYVCFIPTDNGHERNILQITPKAWGSPASKLADLVLAGHPDKSGKARIRLSDAERQRIISWIDLNAPYYRSMAATATRLVKGRPLGRDLTRREPLRRVLRDVVRRRCASCHENTDPRRGAPWKPWIRVQNPQLNSFLLAPLARKAGGTGACGKPVFAGTDDPDYRAILKSFEPILESIRAQPRLDMPGGRTVECPWRPRSRAAPSQDQAKKGS